MKKLLAILTLGALALTVAAMLTGCGEKDKADSKATTAATTTPTTKPAETKATTAVQAQTYADTESAAGNTVGNNAAPTVAENNTPAPVALSAEEQAAVNFAGIAAENAVISNNGYTETEEGNYHMYVVTDKISGESNYIYVNAGTLEAMDIRGFWERFPQYSPGGGNRGVESDTGENIGNPEATAAG